MLLDERGSGDELHRAAIVQHGLSSVISGVNHSECLIRCSFVSYMLGGSAGAALTLLDTMKHHLSLHLLSDCASLIPRVQ